MKKIILFLFVITFIKGLQAQNSDATVCAQVGDHSVVNIRSYVNHKYVSSGSGVVVAKNIVVTNYHVIQNKRNNYVYKSDKKYFSTRILYANQKEDIAVIQINSPQNETLEPICLGDSGKIKKGEKVYAIGNSLGLYANDNRISEGIISTNRKNMIETTASIHHGNSGGALINAKCQLIGITTAIWEDQSDMGLAIPVNMVKNILKKLNISYKECEYITKDNDNAPTHNDDTSPFSNKNDDDYYDDNFKDHQSGVWKTGIVLNLKISLNKDLVDRKEKVTAGHSDNTRPSNDDYATTGDTILYSLQKPIYASVGFDFWRKIDNTPLTFHVSADLLSLKKISFYYLILGSSNDELKKDGVIQIWGLRPGISVEWSINNLLSFEGGAYYYLPYSKSVSLEDYSYGAENSFFPESFIDASGFEVAVSVKFNLSGNLNDSFLIAGFNYDMAPLSKSPEKSRIQSVSKQMILLRYVFYF